MKFLYFTSLLFALCGIIWHLWIYLAIATLLNSLVGLLRSVLYHE